MLSSARAVCLPEAEVHVPFVSRWFIVRSEAGAAVRSYTEAVAVCRGVDDGIPLACLVRPAGLEVCCWGKKRERYW